MNMILSAIDRIYFELETLASLASEIPFLFRWLHSHLSLRCLCRIIKLSGRAPRLNISKAVYDNFDEGSVIEISLSNEDEESNCIYTSSVYSELEPQRFVNEFNDLEVSSFSPGYRSEFVRLSSYQSFSSLRCQEWVSDNFPVKSTDSDYETADLLETISGKGSYQYGSLQNIILKKNIADSIAESNEALSIEPERVSKIEIELAKMRDQLAKLIMIQESHLFVSNKVETTLTKIPPPIPPPPPPVIIPKVNDDWRKKLLSSKKDQSLMPTSSSSFSMDDVLKELKSGNIKLKPATERMITPVKNIINETNKVLTPSDIIATALKARFSVCHLSNDDHESIEDHSDSWLKDTSLNSNHITD